MSLNINKTFPIIIYSHLGTQNAYFGVQNDMLRTHSGLRNDIKDRKRETQPQHIDGHALVVVLTVEPVTMAGVQTMIQEMFVEHMEDIRQLIREDKKERTTSMYNQC